jgi:hypothetical protein
MAFWTRKVSAPYSMAAPDNPFRILHGLLCTKIREGRALELKGEKTGWAIQKKWAQDVINILSDDERNWMPEIQELQMLGDTYYERTVMPLRPSWILARQIKAIEAFAWRLYNKQVI